MKLKLLIITLTAGLVYGLIEAIILLISEKTIEDKIYEWEINRQHYFDRFAAGLLTGGIASTIALLVSGFLAKSLILSKIISSSHGSALISSSY